MNIDELFPDISPDPAEHCCDCGKLTRAPIAIRHLHTTNGPGTTLYTCPHCFPNHDPGPTPGDLIWKQ
ncbi:hypothetical protein [Streptomyces albipurpureus]|uniref:Small CPxCG-related zinc finger protein n=1 Tax=Streptomyces albipurpureus TaxID=2897419 RepID=A0ABT0USD8_9ACTN|nr:hypothetical protein [Streptomyces sp. CWNU-1]MCM2391291.1 hypothetical protein [Streptomyces sp. CWNU-1]